jgi:hypothetical protein
MMRGLFRGSLDILNRSRHFRIEAFDTRAAIEVAAVSRQAMDKGNKKGATLEAPWQKIKIDRQIVAIAKVNGATTIYSNDSDVAAHAKLCGIAVLKNLLASKNST